MAKKISKVGMTTLVVRVTVKNEDAEEMRTAIVDAIGEGPECIYSTKDCVASRANEKAYREAYDE